MTSPSQSMTNDFKLRSPRVLFAEGIDEIEFLGYLIEWLGLRDKIQLKNAFGKDKFGSQITVVLKEAKIQNFSVTAVGIIRDNDTNYQGSFASAQQALRENSLPIPSTVGAVASATTNEIKTMITTLPHHNQLGALEELCLETVPAEAIGCIDNYLKCMYEHGLLLSSRLGKSKVHAYLASTSEPTSRVGAAVKNGVWDANHQAFNDLKNFLTTFSSL